MNKYTGEANNDYSFIYFYVLTQRLQDLIFRVSTVRQTKTEGTHTELLGKHIHIIYSTAQRYRFVETRQCAILSKLPGSDESSTADSQNWE
jgi:hypothetical protein